MEARVLGRVDYLPTYQAMREFTAARTADTADELWLCEHPPVYTLGLAADRSHVLAPGDIPLVPTDRGGEVTFHGPGQVVAYPLVDLRRAGYFIKEYVFRLEEAAIRTLAAFDVTGHRVRGAPGIYVRTDDPFGHARLQPDATDPFAGLGKIAALGVKVSRHCTYHGLALNVAMDLQPFTGINACGYPGLKTVDLSTIGVSTTPEAVAQVLGQELGRLLAA